MVPLGIFRSQQFSGAERGHLRGVRRARHRHLPARRAPADRPRLLGARGRRVAAPDHRVHAAAVGPCRRPRPAHRTALADDDRPDRGRGRHGAPRPGRAGHHLLGDGVPGPRWCSGSGSPSPWRRSPRPSSARSRTRTPASRPRSTTRSRASPGCSPWPCSRPRQGSPAAQGLDLDDGFSRAMYIAAALAAIGGVLACLTIRRAAFVESVAHANPAIPCYDTGVRVAGSAR